MADIVLKDVRLSYSALWTPKVFGEDGSGEPYYKANFVFPPNHPQVGEIVEAMKKTAREKKEWGDKYLQIYEEAKRRDFLCLKDGANVSWDGYPGMLYVTSSARIDKRPLVVDRNSKPLTAADGRPYDGCYVIAKLHLWAQSNKFGKKINAQLLGVQFLRNGEAFSGGAPPATPDEFDNLDAGADDDILGGEEAAF